MKKNSGKQAVINFIGQHPGCSFQDIRRDLRAAMLQAGNSPVIPDGYVMVPINMTAEQMRAVQRDSALGTFASAHLKGAFDLYREFWGVAVAAAPQEVRKSNVVDTYQGADGKEHEIIYLTSSQKELK